MTSIQQEILSIRSDLVELKELILKKSGAQVKEILSAEETMELLNINRSSFDRLRKEGVIKAYRLKRKLYCKYSEVMQAIENGFIEASIN